MMELFRSTSNTAVEEAAVAFEKSAAAKHLLSDNPQSWPSELTAFLFKDRPWLGRYEVNIQIDSQDDGRGYLYGSFLVKQHSNVPPSPTNPGYQSQDASPSTDPNIKSPLIRVPIIVEAKKAYPFDVFINTDNQFLPLSEERVSASMFDADPFSNVQPNAVGQGVGNATMQPGLPAAGLGTAGYASSGVAGSADGSGGIKTSSVLDRVGITPEQVQEAFTALNNDAYCKERVRECDTLRRSFQKLAAISEEGVHKRLYAGDEIDELPCLIIKTASGYRVHYSSEGMMAVSMTNAEAEGLPLSVRTGAIQNGSVVLNAGAQALPDVLAGGHAKTASESGCYQVIDAQGHIKKATIFTDILDLAGQPTSGVAVFTAEGAKFQEKVAAVSASVGPVVGSHDGWESAFGEATLLVPAADGSPVALTEPFTITGRDNSGASTDLLISHPMLGPGRMVKSACSRPRLTHVRDETVYLIPAAATLIALGKTKVAFRDNTYLFDQHRHIGMTEKIASLRCNGDGAFELQLAGMDSASEYLDEDYLLLALVSCGDSEAGGREKIARAKGTYKQDGRTVQFYTAPNLVKHAHFATTGTDACETGMEKFSDALRLDLLKEAAALASSAEGDTVDAVLSLNFITPENIQGYVDSIPELEIALGRLSELLIGARLGLKDVPDSVVSSAVNGIESTIRGLNKLKIRQDYENRPQ